MFKFKFDMSDFNTDDLVQGLKTRFSSATAALLDDANQEAHRYASQKLKKGLSHISKGLSLHKVSDDFYIIAIEGMMANWMEDGMKAGEVSKSIMSGNRAASNKAAGKDYVDVPISKDADSSGNISSGKSKSVNVRAFANAEQLMKSINVSDWKKGGIKQKQVIQSRVRDIIKNVQPENKKASFMTIRRVTDKSKWPNSDSQFSGAKVLEHLDRYINDNFEKILERFL